MLNKLTAFSDRNGLILPGDSVTAAVSGGADSVAMLFALMLMRDTVDFHLEAAHFNHCLRGAESDRDEQFVRELCEGFHIPLTVGRGEIVPGKKGLEAAAREARYHFLLSLPGKIATAHTADDNAETILMHMLRGTGLKGLGGIAPRSGRIIRPMLRVTRRDVEEFLDEYHLSHIEDSSNDTEAYLRNRIRHLVMPVLREENPRFSENMTSMALRLRADESCLASCASGPMPPVSTLRTMPEAVRVRYLERFLKDCGVPEPEERHLALADTLVFSDNPSARADLPGGITVCREYEKLAVLKQAEELKSLPLPCPGSLELHEAGIRIICAPAEKAVRQYDCFCIAPHGPLTVRSRAPGDSMRLLGGSKSLKKLMVDRKIPAPRRGLIPVIADRDGVCGVYGFGVNLDREAVSLPAVMIRFETITNKHQEA